jgi:hypothetical protein
MIKDKKGLSTIQLFLFIFASFFGIVFLGLAIWGFDLVKTNLGVDVMIGQVNLQNATNQTFGMISDAMVTNGDTIGVILLLGMCLLMIMNGYYFGSKYPKFFLIIDIFVIIFAFLLAVYISQAYETLINSSSIFSFYADDLPKSSTFILNLPLIISIVGVLIMIVSYAGIKKDDQDDYSQEQYVAGYQ